MQFRTEISLSRPHFNVCHSDGIVMLGSCFTDEVGARLSADGFDVTANPLGPVFNPISLARLLERCLDRYFYTADDLHAGPRGFHCLEFASRYSGESADDVIVSVNRDIKFLSEKLRDSATVILTFGSAFVFELKTTGCIVGNCHKFPADCFTRRRLSVDEIVAAIKPVIERLIAGGKNVILTVSPIRHLADGLHGNTLSKATLQLALDSLMGMSDFVDYFPSYEILIDDLRDYRFYASDMKHPSDVAVDYVYELFGKTYFLPQTVDKAREARAAYKRSNHRQILS